jgi:hypothetical protein
MSLFEDFVNLELPRRPTLLTNAITSYDGNPNLSVAAIINSAPIGTLFLEETAKVLWQKHAAGATTWEVSGGGGTSIGGVSTATSAETHVYVDGSSGSDSNDGLTALTPKKTLQAAFDLLPDIIKHNTAIHLTGTFDDLGFVRGHLPTTTARLLIDGGDAVTVVAGAFTATDPETDATQIGDSGQSWTVDAYAGYFVEVIDGPAAGEVRMIQGNTATVLTPCQHFSTDPGPTPQFRVIKPTTLLSDSGLSGIIVNTTGLGDVRIQRLSLGQASVIWSLYSPNVIKITHIVDEGTAGYPLYLEGAGEPALWSERFDPTTFTSVTTSRAGYGQRGSGTILASSLNIGGLHASYLKSLQLSNIDFTNWTISVGTRINGSLVGFSLRDSASNFFVYNGGSDADIVIDGASGVGIRLVESIVGFGQGTVQVSSCGSHGIEVDGGKLIDRVGIGGSGNTGAGIYAHSGAKVHIKDGSPPTITGTVGDLAVSNPAAEEETWANIDGGTKVAVAAEMTIAKEVP